MEKNDMGSSHENDQKAQELRCLQIAIEARKQQKGESRKILALLDGEDVYRAHEERPDFVRRISPQKEGAKGVLLGIEHFRVDHLAIKKHSKKGKKAQFLRIASVAPVLNKKKRATYEKWNNCLDENGILPEEFFEDAAKDLFDLAGEHMQKVTGTNYRSLLASLQQNLETHVKSIPTYQENLRKIAQPGEKIQIALLIDLYAEFFSLMKFDSRGIRACKIGEVPLFQEVIALIERIIDKSAVDYVIFIALGYAVAVTQLVPGLSATALLMMFGWFTPIINSVSLGFWREFPQVFAVYLCLAAGFAAGIFTVSKLLSGLMKRKRVPTFCAVAGLSLGSMLSMFFNPDIYAVYKSWSGAVMIRDLCIGTVLFAAGVALAYVFVRYERRKNVT